MQRVRQRLLDINVLAGLHGGHADHRVAVIRRGDDDGVNVLLFVEHFAVIAIFYGPRIKRGDLGRALAGIHIAQGHDVLVHRAFLDVIPAHAADADGGDVELAAGWRLAARAEDITGDDGKGGGGGRGALEKTPPAGFGRPWFQIVGVRFHAGSFVFNFPVFVPNKTAPCEKHNANRYPKPAIYDFFFHPTTTCGLLPMKAHRIRA